MNSSELQNRLIALVGENEAIELLNNPNEALNGKTLKSIVNDGNSHLVEAFVESLELRKKSNVNWIKAPPLAVELLLTGYQRRP